MDLGVYYQKIRDVEASIQAKFPVVISEETADGGKTGVLVEVTRRNAARMIVDGTAKLASAEDTTAFRQQQAKAKQMAEQAAAAAKVQVAILSADELAKLGGSKPAKG